ncbi:MAG TPA: FAD:protein FMN transferase [Alphaproteobacteria bacterium]|nr:FAD:protein FMN transferase [Alphaproteobacteria bacterium]
MGSPCEIQLFAAGKTEAGHVTNMVTAEVERLEALYSRYRDTSFLSEINRAAAEGGSITVDAETAQILNYAATCHAESDGLFDITSGILRRAWRFDRDQPPDAGQVEALLDRVGWDKLRWEPPVLSFTVAGMEIDFGGIVKEYAVDSAAAICKAQGVPNAVVNLGGDIHVVGPRGDGSPWRVGIRHPRQAGGVLETLSIREGALASSGDYERCITFRGRRYGHILNPRTGWPVRHMAAVSVLGDLCVVSGSASTIGMLREEDGPAWLADLGLPHLWVDTNGAIGGPLAAPVAR